MDKIMELAKQLGITNDIHDARKEMNPMGKIVFIVCCVFIGISIYKMCSSANELKFLIYGVFAFVCLGIQYWVYSHPLFKENTSQSENIQHEQHDGELIQPDSQKQEDAESYDKSADAETQYKLGAKYYYRKEYEQAEPLLRKSAEHEIANAQYFLGCIYSIKQDYLEAFKWWYKAAEQKHTEAQCSLGNLYRKGRGVAQDYAEAVRWYSKAADQGHANAQFQLATMYKTGEGVTQDYKEAVELYRKVAEHGFVEALYSLGEMHENGYGVAKDLDEACIWYQKAADKGSRRAQEALDRLR